VIAVSAALFVAAMATLLVALAYFVVTTVVDLFPYNNVRDASASEKRTEVLVNGAIMLVPIALLIVAVATGLPVIAWIAGALQLILALGGLLLWWLPYLTGVAVPWATAGTGATWSELHERTYSRTIMVLPRIGERPRPNLEHIVLHALMIAGGVLAILAGAV
jgi:hypothetical protein